MGGFEVQGRVFKDLWICCLKVSVVGVLVCDQTAYRKTRLPVTGAGGSVFTIVRTQEYIFIYIYICIYTRIYPSLSRLSRASLGISLPCP